jgi:hypothetical protein
MQKGRGARPPTAEAPSNSRLESDPIPLQAIFCFIILIQFKSKSFHATILNDCSTMKVDEMKLIQGFIIFFSRKSYKL